MAHIAACAGVEGVPNPHSTQLVLTKPVLSSGPPTPLLTNSAPTEPPAVWAVE